MIKVDFSLFGFVLFGSFVVFMLSLVFLASSQKVELVKENYYEEELNFQTLRVKTERAIAENKELKFQQNGNQLLITFSGLQKATAIKGKAVFYKPDDQNQDRTVNFESSSETKDKAVIDISDFKAGYYQVRVEWADADIFSDDGEQGYAVETQVNIIL